MEDLMKKIISLTKRRGFIFPCSEIYGGIGGIYDFGPLGAEMKNNLKNHWSHFMKSKEEIVAFDSALILNKDVWEASGHLSHGFADKLVECKNCHKRFKADELEENKCISCEGELTEPKDFNLMMKTFLGPVENEAGTAYLRAETCQGIFINFKNIVDSQRMKIPFGVIQTGKSFRNEITPGNFVFRMREFEQMEMEWFTHPDEADRWFNFWLEKRLEWYKKLGIKDENLRTIEVPEEERAHYARRQVDIEYKFPFGWKEIEGIHNRGDWDLSTHSKHSNEDLKYKDPKTKEKYYPYIIETSVGVERSLLAFLVESFEEVEGGRSEKSKSNKEETILRIPKELAPVKVVVFPLVKNKEKLVNKTKEIYKEINDNFTCRYDESGSIGRRYRRADEIGVPFAITVDFDSLEDEKVTVRDRDTMNQERVEINRIVNYLNNKLTQ